MDIRRAVFSALAAAVPCVVVSAQDIPQDQPSGMALGTDNKEIVYTKFAQGGFSFLTNGYTVSFRRLHTKSAFFEHGYEIDLSFMRNPKEVAVRNYTFIGNRRYVYGKLNSHFNLRIGYGINKEIADKADIGAVEINYFISGGLSLALLKPVYLWVIESDGIVKRRYDPEKHPQDVIVGGTWFFNGLDKIKPHPGLYLRVGLNFDYSFREKNIFAVEVGTVVDYYFSELPVMKSGGKNYSLYNAFYISLNFGRKWN